jgi:hypothetical protein
VNSQPQVEGECGMWTVGLRAAGLTLLFWAAVLAAPPTAGADPFSGPCDYIGMIGEEEIKTHYWLCTGAGWVYIDRRLVTSGNCARRGTVAPRDFVTYYTICTVSGWVDINRSACMDFPGLFEQCAVRP